MEVNSVFVVLGAGGAVLAILILAVLRDVWVQGLLPLWRRWNYRGVNISGGWKGLGNVSTPASGEWTEVGLSVKQHLCELQGVLWIRRCSAERTSELRMPLSGRISDGYVTLAASPVGQSAVAHAAALLKIESRDSRLSGQLLYQDTDTETVEGIHLSVYRASSMALPSLRPLRVHAAVAGAA